MGGLRCTVLTMHPSNFPKTRQNSISHTVTYINYKPYIRHEPYIRAHLDHHRYLVQCCVPMETQT